MYMILKYVILERKLSFYQETKIKSLLLLMLLLIHLPHYKIIGKNRLNIHPTVQNCMYEIPKRASIQNL